MRSRREELQERARRREAEDRDAAETMRVLVTLPAHLRRDRVRAHATAGMVLALAAHARNATEDAFSFLTAAEDIAATLRDPYDGPHARSVLWSARGALLRARRRFAEALSAFDRAGWELDAAPVAFGLMFRADLAMERAELLLEMGDAIAARRCAWSATEWYRAVGDRAGLARVAGIVDVT